MATATSKMSRTAWGLDTMPDGEWLEQAACDPTTAHLFDVYASKGIREQTLTAANEQAIAICLRCPVRVDCLDDALAHPIDWWFVAGGEVIHRGEIVPTKDVLSIAGSRRARSANLSSPNTTHERHGRRHTPAAHPVVDPASFAEARGEQASVAEAVADLLGLGWGVERVASALGIGVTAVRHHTKAVHQ